MKKTTLGITAIAALTLGGTAIASQVTPEAHAQAKTATQAKAPQVNEATKEGYIGTCPYVLENGHLTIKAGQMDGPLNEESAGLTNTPNREVPGITSITIEPGVKAPTTQGNWFELMPDLQKVDGLNNLDVSESTRTDGLFNRDTSLKSVSITSKWDCSKSNVLANWFFGCKSLKSADLSGLTNTHNVTDINGMFLTCPNVTSIKFGKNLDTSNINNYQNMFSGDLSLTSLDLSMFNTFTGSGVPGAMHNMFGDPKENGGQYGQDRKLSKLTLGHMTYLAGDDGLNVGNQTESQKKGWHQEEDPSILAFSQEAVNNLGGKAPFGSVVIDCGGPQPGTWIWNHYVSNKIVYEDNNDTPVGNPRTVSGIEDSPVPASDIKAPQGYTLQNPEAKHTFGKNDSTIYVRVKPDSLNPGRPVNPAENSVSNTIVYKDINGNQVGVAVKIDGPLGSDVTNKVKDGVPAGYQTGNPDKKYELESNGTTQDVVVIPTKGSPIIKPGDHEQNHPNSGKNHTPSKPATPNKPANSNNGANGQHQNGNNGAQGNVDVNGNDGVRRGSKVYAMKGINIYKRSNLTGKIKHYKKVKRTNRPRFTVKKIVRTNKGAVRYYVKQVNHKVYGWVSGNTKLVQNNFYQPRTKPVKFRVLNHKGINSYKTLTLHKKAKHLKYGSVVKARRVKKEGVQTRFQLSNGTYVSARKNFVIYK